MPHRRWSVLPFGLALAALTACYGMVSTGPVDGSVPGCADDTNSIQKNVFVPSCGAAGCHGSDPNSNVDLVSPLLESRIVGVPAQGCGGQTFVVPGDPDASYLYRKIADAPPACGERMPFGGTLSAATIACVRSWITKLGPAPTDGGSPEGSIDAGPTCPPGKTSCNGTCVDLTNDKSNCGKCGTVCPVACAASACVTTCPSPTTNCNGSCTDVTKDPLNCGTCGKACPTGQQCTASACSCGPAVSFSAKVQPIFTASCTGAGCHAGAVPKAGLNLSTGKSYAALVNVASSSCTGKIRVKPAAVDQSYLMNKLTGVGMCSGTQMPKIGTSLPAGDLDAIRGWVCSGAPNN